MKSILRVFLLIIFSSLLFLNTQCDDDISCNDCLEFDPKAIEIVDADGNNLIIGEFAIYNQENIKILAADEIEIPFFFNETNGRIEFGIDPGFENYELVLTETESDFISFETDLRPSENCCGDVRFSTGTFVNNAEVDNDDLITIVKN